ncbi:MAG: hypothetical protein ACXAD7_06660 [Candidatus Kariarchaeaceae archaeon]|jgi:hypothetical protein
MKNAYYVVGIVGFVLSLLEAFVADDMPLAYSVFLLTLTALSFMYIYSEWRYYRSHNAILASSQFLLIPSGLILLGNILAPKAADGSVIHFSISSFLISTHSNSTITSALLIPPVLMFINLIGKYYKKQYTGFVIRRRILNPVKFPLLINLLLLLGVYFTSSAIGVIDFVTLLFVVWSIIVIIKDLILPAWRASRAGQQVSRDRRRYVDTILSTSPRVSSRSIDDGSRRVRGPRPRQGDIPTRSRSGTRTVSTNPSQGYREVTPRTPRSQARQEQPRPSNRTRPRGNSAVAHVEGGVSMHRPSRKASKVASSKLKKFFPSGNFTKDDLRCIICYQNFEGNGNVSICPKCKYPAHEVELKEWFDSSNMCPRCSRDITSNGNAKSLLKMSEKQYHNIVKKL